MKLTDLIPTIKNGTQWLATVVLSAAVGSGISYWLQEKHSANERIAAKVIERRRLHSKLLGLSFSAPSAIVVYETGKIIFESKSQIQVASKLLKADRTLYFRNSDAVDHFGERTDSWWEIRSAQSRELMETLGLIQTTFEDTEELEKLILQVNSYQIPTWKPFEEIPNKANSEEWLKRLYFWREKTMSDIKMSVSKDFVPRILKLADYLKMKID